MPEVLYIGKILICQTEFLERGKAQQKQGCQCLIALEKNEILYINFLKEEINI